MWHQLLPGLVQGALGTEEKRMIYWDQTTSAFCNYKNKGSHSLDEISKKAKLFLSLTKFQHISAKALSTPTDAN